MSPTNSIILKLWKLNVHAYLRSQGKQKIIWESKKIYELKIFENWVELKLFERKLEFWNLFENWSLKKLLKN